MLNILLCAITVLLFVALALALALIKQKQAPTTQKKSPFFSLNNTLKITYIAVFTALSVIAGAFQIPMGSTDISLSYIPTFLAGAFFGPVAGFTVGVLGDLIGVLFNGGAPLLPLTLGNGMIGALMGFAFLLPCRSKTLKIIIGAIAALFVVTLGINSVTLWYYYGAGRTFWVYLTVPVSSILPRIIMQPIILAINVALTIPLFHVLERTLMKRFRSNTAK